MGFSIRRTEEDNAGGKPLDLGAAIAEFYQDFPEHKADVFIMNHQQFTSGREAVASLAAGLEAVKLKFPAAQLGFAKSLAMGLFEGKLPASVNISDSPFLPKPESPIFARIVNPAGEEFSARIMKSIFVASDPIANDRFPTMASRHNDTEMWQRYVLDHELGHAVTQLSIDKQAMKTSSLGNKAECEADAYAMIRHYQRYGSNSDFPEYVRDLRNMNVVHKGDVTHWTTRAVEEVIALNAAGKLQNLSPQQARDLAVDIASRTHLSADAEYNMGQAFAATVRLTKAAMAKDTPDGDRLMSYLAAACNIGANTESPAVLEACRHYKNTIVNYAAPELPQTKTKEELAAIAKDAGAMLRNAAAAEPEMKGLKRIFRDAMIDASSGKGAANNNAPPKKKPSDPKAG